MDRQASSPSQTRFRLELPTTAFPFRRELSLAPLVAAWEAAAAEPGHRGRRGPGGLPGARPGARAAGADRGSRPCSSATASWSRSSCRCVFPAASWGEDYGAAAVPFQLRAVHATPSFRRLLLDEQGFVQGWLNLDAEDAARGRLLYAYDAILRVHYGMTLDVDDHPFTLAARDPESGLERHFRIQLDTRFLEVRALAPVPPLDEATRRAAAPGRRGPAAPGGAVPAGRVRVLRLHRRCGRRRSRTRRCSPPSSGT